MTEPESSVLAGVVRTGPGMISSALARIEVIRAVRRKGPVEEKSARLLMASVDSVDITDQIINEAGRIGRLQLRSLDAIHLATALELRSALTGFVAYDRRLLDAAAALGLRPMSPGLDG
ncbi:MAG: PIN domain-containing protein [Actinomycetota bacterium]|nr:PIN domain-containing protein [Actinomycetota bacterium]